MYRFFFVLLFSWILLWHNRPRPTTIAIFAILRTLHQYRHQHIIFNYSFIGLVLRPYLSSLMRLIKDQCTAMYGVVVGCLLLQRSESYRLCHTNWSTFTLLFLICSFWKFRVCRSDRFSAYIALSRNCIGMAQHMSCSEPFINIFWLRFIHTPKKPPAVQTLHKKRSWKCMWDWTRCCWLNCKLQPIYMRKV